MYIIDDPILVLITRFMGDTQHLNVSDAEFLLRQITAIEHYVDKFPPDERNTHAMEWITAHAQQYRRQWQKNVIVQALIKARCPDCPLAGGHRLSHCEIHDLWLKLLQQYIVDEISSQEYVENTLKLLGQYKNRLRVNSPRKRLPLTTAQPDTA